jgi:hypothetical protein
MNSSILPRRRTLTVLLLLAPTLELVEAVTSPLRDGSNRSELDRIAAHQGLFEVSTLCGLVATFLYLPMFLGLADACRAASPRLAGFAGWVLATSMAAFVGIRTVGAVQLQAVRDDLDRGDVAALLDHLAGVPTAALTFVLFLGGALVGLISLGVLVWRAGLPKPAAVLLIAFQFVDLVPGRWSGVASHALLLVALAATAWALAHREAPLPTGNRVDLEPAAP